MSIPTDPDRSNTLAGLAALVTGAGTGIGRAAALELARRGADVSLVGRREAPLREVESEITSLGSRSLVIVCDITDAEHAQAAVETAAASLGRLDILVNNAGFAPLVPLAKTTPELIRETFATNALAPAWLIVAAWPHLARHKTGCIVNVSTLGTRDPFPGFFAYAAAKGSVNVMTMSCAIEGRQAGIRAFSVAPGAVETDMLRANFSEKSIPRGAALPPEAVAGLVADCVDHRYDHRNGDTIFISASGGIV